jgi:uncharacterized protein (DUF2461 family)
MQFTKKQAKKLDVIKNAVEWGLSMNSVHFKEVRGPWLDLIADLGPQFAMVKCRFHSDQIDAVWEYLRS